MPLSAITQPLRRLIELNEKTLGGRGPRQNILISIYSQFKIPFQQQGYQEKMVHYTVYALCSTGV